MQRTYMVSGERPTTIMDISDLKGTLNFRAVAAFATTEGRRLRQNWLYRSGTFENIGPSGGAALRALGIAAVLDLRTGHEVAAHPAPLTLTPGLRLVAPRHAIRLGDLSRVVRDPFTTAADVRSAMIQVYRDIPAGFAPIFRQVFHHATTSDAPFVINCTAGKDRTGTAIALILSALGVARDDIFTDYLQSNAAGPALRQMLRTARGGIDYAALDDAVIAPLHAVDAAYLRAFFDEIEARFGAVDRYLAEVLGISDRTRRDLSDRLLV